MNDTFANNKVCEDERWPWEDEMEKKAQTRENQKKPGFSPVFWPPLRSSKKTLRIIFWRNEKITTDEWRMDRKHETRKTLYFPGFFDCNKSKRSFAAPGRAFFIALVRRGRFSTRETHKLWLKMFRGFFGVVSGPFAKEAKSPKNPLRKPS